MSDYEDMTVAQLIELLKEAGLPVSGMKADLIARLQEGSDEPAPVAFCQRCCFPEAILSRQFPLRSGNVFAEHQT